MTVVGASAEEAHHLDEREIDELRDHVRDWEDEEQRTLDRLFEDDG